MPDREHKLRGSDPRFNEPRHRGDCRQLDLRDGVWQWKIGADTAFIYSPLNECHEVKLWTLLEMNEQDWRGISEDFDVLEPDIPITPKDISDFVNEKLLGRKLLKWRPTKAA